MKIKNPETGEVIVVPQGMEDAVRDAIESGNDPIEVMQMKYGGIHINPANKGKFNATKKATGKTTEELTHSKNLLTRKRAIFAQNAKKWKHQDGGQAMQQEDQMQQLIQIAEQALSQGAAPEQVAQMLVEKGVPEQVVQQVIQYAIQDLQQQSQGQNPQEEAQEQGQQQNPQEEQAEMGYGGYMQKGGNGLSKEATMALQNPNIRSQPYINGAFDLYTKTGDTNALNNYNAYTEANKYLLQRDSVQNANNTDYYPYGNARQQRFIQKENGGMSMYDDGGMAMYGNGGMIKRADGSYSKRGLWDNIRANKGSGKAPTKEMLEQESKIRAREAAYGGAYGNGGGIDNPGFRALPAYVQQNIINNMQTGGKFLRKAKVGLYDDNQFYNPEYNNVNSLNTFGNFQNPLDQYNPNDAYNPNASAYGPQLNQSTKPFISPLNPTAKEEPLYLPKRGLDENENIAFINNGSYGYDPSTGGNLDSSKNMQKIPVTPNFTPKNKSNWFNNYNSSLSNITGGNSYFGRGISHLGQATFDFTKGGLELAGTNISNRNALGDEARDLQNSMRAGYKKVGKRFDQIFVSISKGYYNIIPRLKLIGL
jgi:hypothetical protein